MTKEIIQEINWIDDFALTETMKERLNEGFVYGPFEGVHVKTNKQDIYALISNQESCCENWGSFSSHEDEKAFIGKELLNVKLVEKVQNEQILKRELEYGVDEGDILFIDLETPDDVLQFVLYNAHNGYYGHSAIVLSEQVTMHTYL